LEWTGRFDFATVMVEGIRDFIPQLRIERPDILFNRRQVDLLAMILDKKQV